MRKNLIHSPHAPNTTDRQTLTLLTLRVLIIREKNPHIPSKKIIRGVELWWREIGKFCLHRNVLTVLKLTI